MKKTSGLSLLLAAAAVSAGVAIAQAPASTTPPAMRPAAAMQGGYLPKGATPSSLSLLPAPPAKGSATQARDNAMAKIARSLKGSPRWSQATLDADLKFPGAANTYSCAVGVDINPQATPRLYVLLQRTLIDAGLATYPTKTKYQRPRPFMVAGGDICRDGTGWRMTLPHGRRAHTAALALIAVVVAGGLAASVFERT